MTAKSPLKIGIALVLFLFFVPVVLLAWLQLAGTGMMAAVFYQVSSILEPEGDPFGGKIDIRNARLSSWRLKSGLKAIAGFGEFNSARAIHVATVTTLRDLLKPGEKMPSKDSHDLYVRSRVGFIAKEECNRLLELLARACEFSNTNASRWRGNLYNVSFTLRFIQKDAFGEINSEATLNYTEIDDEFSNRLRNARRWNDKYLAKVRVKAYKKFSKDCKSIKKDHGNCALLNAVFQLRAMDVNNGPVMVTNATFSVLQKL